MMEGEVVRLGPVRSVVSTTPFSTKTHEEHSQQIDVRLHSLPDSTVRVTLYAPSKSPSRKSPVETASALRLPCTARSDISIRACGTRASICSVRA
jgi:hypothetical protein